MVAPGFRASGNMEFSAVVSRSSLKSFPRHGLSNSLMWDYHELPSGVFSQTVAKRLPGNLSPEQLDKSVCLRGEP